MSKDLWSLFVFSFCLFSGCAAVLKVTSRSLVAAEAPWPLHRVLGIKEVKEARGNEHAQLPEQLSWKPHLAGGTSVYWPLLFVSKAGKYSFIAGVF